jgi:hypothetical protein
MWPKGAKVEPERERCVPKVVKLSFEVSECKPLPGGHVYQSMSANLGVTWTTPRPVGALPNPDAAVHGLRLQPTVRRCSFTPG